MKRIAITALALAIAPLVGCDKNIPVDNPDENVAIPGPRGIIRGVVNYLGPPPCFRNGLVEGQVVLLLFDAGNPPPPDGLASTALNFATVPGEKLFANVARPAKGQPGGPGNASSFCPSVNTQPIAASTDWSMQQVGAGRFQVRGFYSRQSRWNPLFNFANLALAGDVAGGFVVDPRAAITRFATVEVGVPDAKDATKLVIPDSGFVRSGIPVNLGAVLRTNRPFFHIDYASSNSFDVSAPPDKGDFTTNYAAQRKPLTGAQTAMNGFITFPQDHLSTSQSKVICAANPDPACDLFEIAQASFPQIRFKYGFPGDVTKPGAPSDAWVAKNAKPRDPFSAERVRPFYGIDPREFEADNPTSGKFVLTRNFDAAGKPEILRDNPTLEDIAQIADIFPSVVLSKLAEDGDGGVALPPRSQTDPIVVIQTITLKDWQVKGFEGKGSMKATSQGAVAGGGLTDASGNPDPNNPLAKRDGFVAQDGFTALVRPSVVCIYPQDDLKGTLVTPVSLDPNPENPGAILVSREKILLTRANRVKNVQYGCLPPGYYSVNVVYPTGQAWSFPNLSGHCSYTAKFEPNEECMNTNVDPAVGGFPWLTTTATKSPLFVKGGAPEAGFGMRPLLRSQSLYKTDGDGKIMLDAAGNPILQVVKITQSNRCGAMKAETELPCVQDADCIAAPFTGVCIPGPTGGTAKFCDVNGDGRITDKKIYVNNPMNEDISLPLSGNGILDKGEDQNGNNKLDLHVPFTCALPRNKWATLSPDLWTK